MDGKSLTPQELKLQQLNEILPEAFSEGKIDWEKLQATLGEDINFANERYVLNWAGKSDAFKVLQAPTTKTLVPDKKESVNFNKTEHIFIEGENLEVLKVLQKSYFGKVKMIYIDPPYNTGNDSFIYPDKFSETKAEYKKRVGDKDEEGYLTKDGMFRKNSKENGQYHSNWLSMMYPRLFLAKNLLRQDGVIFVSIDDNEVHNLRLMMDEIFGEENFVGSAVRVTKKSNNKGEFWAPNFDYILTYVKDRNEANPFFGGVNVSAYNQVETKGNRKGEKYQLVRLYMSSIQNRNPEQRFYITCPDGTKVIPPGTTFPPDRPNLGDGIWRWTRKKIEEDWDKIVIKRVKSSNLIDENGKPAKWNVYTKTYLSDVINNASAKPNSLIENHINQIASHELNDLEIPFDYSKPTTLIKYLMNISRIGKQEVILDFFAGSGTTGDTVMQLNAEDGGNRKCISVQLPELTDEKSEAYKAGFKTIADIAKERIRRAAKKIQEEINKKIQAKEKEIKELESQLDLDNKEEKIQNLKVEIEKLKNQDLGFKVLKLSESNFKQWQQIQGKNAVALAKQMKLFVDPVSEKATIENMVYELLIKSGKDLNSKLEHKENYYCVNDNELIFMLEKATQEIVDAVIKEKPQKVIALDRLYKDNDQLKTNTSLQMKDAEIEFKTI